MVFEEQTLAVPSVEALRAKLRALPLRRSLLSAGVVLSLTAMGALLPGALLGAGAKDYVSVANVGVTASNGNDTEVRRTIAQVKQAVLSPISLSLAVSDLQLQADDVGGSPEGSRFGFLMNLLLEEPAQNGITVNPAETALQKSVSVVAADNGIDISASAATPEMAQRIADYMSGRVIKEVGIRGHEPGVQVLEQARAGLDNADAALTGFQMRHGEEAISQIRDLQQRARDADAAVSSLSRKSTELKDAVDTVSAMKRDDILTKSLPSLPAFAPAEAMRQSYDTAKLALADVNVDHGPKHPRTIAAQAAVDAARASMLTATRRGLEALKREESAVGASLDSQTAERGEVQKQLTALGDAPAELSRLEAALDKARRDYLATSEKVGPFARTPHVTATLSEKAEPGTARYDTIGTGIMTAGGAMLGLLLSLFVLSFRRPEQVEDEAAFGISDANDVSDNDISLAEAAVVETPFRAEPIEIEPAVFDDIEDVEPLLEKELPSPIGSDEVYGLTDEMDIEAANDVPLDERVRQVLMGNLVRPEVRPSAPEPFRLPPLLAAALAGEAEHQEAETEELTLLRRELALLRDRLRERVDAEEALRKNV